MKTTRTYVERPLCSTGFSTSQPAVFFSHTKSALAPSQQYFSLTINQHQLTATASRTESCDKIEEGKKHIFRITKRAYRLGEMQHMNSEVTAFLPPL
jgi:hypothetical protein